MHASSIDKAALQSHVKAEASSLGFQLGWSVLFVIAAPCGHPHYKQESIGPLQPVRLTHTAHARQHACIFNRQGGSAISCES